MDVLFLKPLPLNLRDERSRVAICTYQNNFATGFIDASKRSLFLGRILDRQYTSLIREPVMRDYQRIGPTLCRQVYNEAHPFMRKEVEFISRATFYPLISNEAHLYVADNPIDLSDSVGIHWYNGHPSVRKWIRSYALNSISLSSLPKCCLSVALKQSMGAAQDIM